MSVLVAFFFFKQKTAYEMRISDWSSDVCSSDLKAKFDAGYAGINWPTDLGGQGLGHLEKITFEGEEMKHGFPNVYFGISLGMPVPVLMQFGGDREFVTERVLTALQGEEIWCQLFSEPSGGTDLAGLRTRAATDCNGRKLKGQKVWPRWAPYIHKGDHDRPP